MKKLFLILILFPLTVLAGEQSSETVKVFKKLCRDETDPELRRHYCQLLEKQLKAEKVMGSFSNNS